MSWAASAAEAILERGLRIPGGGGLRDQLLFKLAHAEGYRGDDKNIVTSVTKVRKQFLHLSPVLGIFDVMEKSVT